MAVNSYNNLNMSYLRQYNPGFRADGQTVPVLSQQSNDSIFLSENPIENITKKIDEEKKKKHNRIAIATSGTVLGVSLLVALLNPKFSGKLVKHLKIVQQKANTNYDKTKDSFLKSNFYKFISKTAGFGEKAANMINNFNSVKDTYFKQLCTEEKSFSGKSGSSLAKWKKADKWFRKIFQKPHEAITKWADWLAKKTVKIKYNRASNRMNDFDALIKKYRNNLSASEQKIFDEKIKELAESRKFFTEEELTKRFNTQESVMETLNEQVRNRFAEYKNGFSTLRTNKKEHFSTSMDFWAEDILKPEQEKIQQEGTLAVEKLFGNKNGEKGIYRELLEIISPYATNDEKLLLEQTLKKTESKLSRANLSECKSYFEKKRDLTLGSAPTDVVTALGGIGLAGIGFAAADSKDEKISKSITSVVPAFAGIGTNIALTSALLSGSVSLGVSTLIGGIISLIGSRIDHYRLKSKAKFLAAQEQNINKNDTEVKNV